jgi:hypothetical protein
LAARRWPPGWSPAWRGLQAIRIYQRFEDIAMTVLRRPRLSSHHRG